MSGFVFRFQGLRLMARPSGGLWHADSRTLVVSDLHLGRSTRMARLRAQLLPPYETAATLRRLAAEIAALQPARVISLGDSFDDTLAMTELAPPEHETLARMTRAQDWVWITGNHDPAPASAPFGGRFTDSLWLRAQDGTGAVLRHIRAEPGPDISGHLHPVVALGGKRWRAFVVSPQHLILPAFGLYTGGLDVRDPAFDGWARPGHALLCASRILEVPLPARH